jgi:hypothetical protein
MLDEVLTGSCVVVRMQRAPREVVVGILTVKQYSSFSAIVVPLCVEDLEASFISKQDHIKH